MVMIVNTNYRATRLLEKSEGVLPLGYECTLLGLHIGTVHAVCASM